MDIYLKEARQMFEYTRALRRDFHQHPELGFQEVRTSGIVARELNKLGLEVSTGIAETGVVGLIRGELSESKGLPGLSETSGPVVLLRFDMDALPITEETGIDYASQNQGVMHACGHDGHTAVGLLVARLLNAHKSDWDGIVKLVFQPAEEGLGGAKRMVQEGVLKNPPIDVSIAFHLWNSKPLGWIGVTNGPAMAAAERFKIRVIGKGGHGAVPHLAVDPVLASAQIINSLQSVISRNVTPLKSGVVSVTMVHGGDAFNVIPSEVELQGTIRTFDPDVRKIVLERLNQIVTGTASAFDCQVEIELEVLTPAVVNNHKIAKNVQEVVSKILPECTLDTQERTMGSEDMAYMMQDIPGCYVFVGSANPDLDLVYTHHHPKFNFDERAMINAAAILTSATIRYLSTN